MKKRISTLAIILIAFAIFFSCRKKDPEPVKPTSSINDLINSASALSDVEASSRVTTQTNNGVSTPSNGSTYNCDKKNIRFANKMEQIAVTAFDIGSPNIADLYPGSIVKLKDLRQSNILTSIGNYPRETTTITSTLPGANSSVVVNNPSKATVESAINQINSGFTGSVPANIVYSVQEAYSLEQGLLEFGINASYLTASVKSKFSFSSEAEKKSVFIVFTQGYQTISVPYPSNPAGFFASNVNVDELRGAVQTDNPLGYVSQVTYGRIVIAQLTSTSNTNITSKDIAAKLQVGLVGGAVSFSNETKSILQTSDIKVAVLGGNAQDAITIVTGASGMDKSETIIKNIDRYIINGANTVTSGVPISYTVRYLSSNSVFSVGGVSEYSEQACKLIPTQVFIKGVKILNIPVDNNGSNWDSFGGDPDVYFTLSYLSNPALFDVANQSYTNLNSTNLPASWTISNPTFTVPNWRTQSIDVNCYDKDTAGDEFMGYVRFNMLDYTIGANAFPNKIALFGNTDVNSNRLQVELELEWK